MNEDYQTAILLLTVNYLPNMKRAEIPRVSAFDILFQFSFPKPRQNFRLYRTAFPLRPVRSDLPPERSSRIYDLQMPEAGLNFRLCRTAFPCARYGRTYLRNAPHAYMISNVRSRVKLSLVSIEIPGLSAAGRDYRYLRICVERSSSRFISFFATFLDDSSASSY